MERFEVPDPHALPERLPPGRTEPRNTQELSPQIDFLYRAVDNFTQSVQFADAKAGGVVLILSIGILDLFKNLRNFLDARDLSAGYGWLATISAVVATAFGLLTVVQIARTLFPHFAKIITTEPYPPRSAQAAELAELARGMGIEAMVEPEPRRAFERALASGGQSLFVGGSLYLAGAAIEYFDGRQRQE